MRHPLPPSRPASRGGNLRRLGGIVACGLLLAAGPARAAVKLTFDTDAQGFTGGYNTQQGSPNANPPENPLHKAVWSPLFGGSVAITGSAGFYFGLSELNINANPLLKAELESAVTNGGTIKFKVRIRQEDIQGASPGYLEGLLVANSQAGFDGQTFAINAPFPITGTAVTDVVIPIYNRAVVGGVQSPPGGAGSVDFQNDSSYNFVLIGLNSGGTGYTAATIYIDDFTIDGVPPPPPPAAGTYTFDEDAQGFGRFATDPVPAYSTRFGGTLAMTSQDVDFKFFTSKAVQGGNELAKLQASAVNGGTVSYDLIAPAGTLADRGITTVLQNYSTYAFSQADLTISAASVKPLPGGLEIARISFPTSQLGAGFISAPGYNFIIGYGGYSANPLTIYLDNVEFLPAPGGAKLTFDTTVQNLTAAPAAIDLYAVNGDAVLIAPPGNVAGAEAVFTAGNADPQVAALYTAFTQAAVKGGMLRFNVRQAFIDNRQPAFAGITIGVSLLGTTVQQRFPTVIGTSDFTEGGSAPGETPVQQPYLTAPGFNRVVSVPLYPAGSTATDGFVLPAGAAQYAIRIGTQSAGIDSLSLTFDNLEVAVKTDLQIVYQPALALNTDGFFVGRILTNAGAGAVYSATGLPPGVTIDPATGLVSGTPTANGTYQVVFTVTQDGSSVSSAATPFIVAVGVIPVISSFTYTGGTAVIQWTNTGASPVRVQRSSTLLPGSFVDISTGDTDHTHTDTSPPAGRAFYRIAAP